MKLTVKLAAFYKAEVHSDDPCVIGALKSYFSFTEESKFMTRGRYPRLMITTKSVSFLEKVDSNTCRFNRGLINFLPYFIKLNYPNAQVEFPEALRLPSGIPLTEKWETIFKGHPKGEERAQMQLDDFKTITSKRAGTIELFTGYGKSELLLAMIEGYLSAYDGNVLVLVPSSGILSELVLRGKKYGVEIGIKDWTKRVNILDPISFYRTNAAKAGEHKEFFNKVQIVITDESHHLSAKSYLKAFNDMPSVDFSYGFSASADKDEGVEIRVTQVRPSDLGSHGSTLVGLSGPCIIRRDLPVPINLYKVRRNISDPLKVARHSGDNFEWTKILTVLVEDPQLASLIADIVVTRGNGKKFYIPIHMVEPGLTLMRNLLNTSKVRVCFWSGDHLFLNGERIEGDPVVRIKEFALADLFDILITSAVGVQGIDVPGIGAYIPLHGKSHRMVTQPLGRAARSDVLDVFLIYDRNNSVLLKQQRERYDRIKKFNVIKEIDI